MTIARYTPGPLVAVVAPGGVALLAADTAVDVVESVWELLRGEAGLGDLIDLLAAGGSLSHVPPFAVAFDDDGTWRVAARGPFSVTAAEESVEGAGASTWAERSIRSGDALTLSGAPGAPAPDATTARALRDGVVGAATVTVTRAADRGAVRAASAAAARGREAAPVAPAEPPQPRSVSEVHDVPASPASAPAGRPASAPAEPPAAPAVPPAVPVAPPLPPVPAAAAAAAPSPSDDGGLIDSISVPSARPPAPASAPTERMPIVGDDEGLDAEVEETIIRDTAPPLGAVEDDKTITLAEARALRATGGLPPVAPPLAAPAPRAAAGLLRVSSGQSVLLDRSVIIGRRPRSNRAGGADLPHLIAVDSPQQDISRNHLEVRVEGDTILATDLQTTNGTTLLRPGSEPVRLHPGEATIVVLGDVLDLGDGITVTVEAAP